MFTLVFPKHIVVTPYPVAFPVDNADNVPLDSMEGAHHAGTMGTIRRVSSGRDPESNIEDMHHIRANAPT